MQHATSKSLALFQQGEDLPLFTGSVVPVVERQQAAHKAPVVDNETMAGWCVRCCAPLVGHGITWTDEGPLCPRCF